MDLEDIRLSEMPYRERQILYVVTCGIQNKTDDEYNKNRLTDTENKLVLITSREGREQGRAR